jgi:hypothetical protein
VREEFVVKPLSDFFSWAPTAKFCLTRQPRIFSSVGIISYRIFPATSIMILCAVLLKVISLQYSHLIKTVSLLHMKLAFLSPISFRSILMSFPERNVDLQCGVLFSGVPSQGCCVFYAYYISQPGHALVQLVEALRYKPEGRKFDSQWSHWNFSLT